MEKLLHYVWKHKILPLRALLTTDGEELEIVDAGLHNHDAGPDFFNAKLRIGGTMWAGNVEIHQKSSDWYRHGHDTDAAYDNVVLHVAQTVDTDVLTSTGKRLPQLQLDIPAGLHQRYSALQRTEDYPRCHPVIPKIDLFTAHSWMDTLLCERLSERAELVKGRLQQVNGDWEWALFTTLARNFGFGLNGDAFEAWARRIPFDRIGKHRDELFQIEAIFLGQAGLLTAEALPQGCREAGMQDDYFRRLQREYRYQRELFQLADPMPHERWRYLRTRPQNFPHIRLAELAWIYCHRTVGLSALKEAVMSDDNGDRLLTCLYATASDYWQRHLLFGQETAKRSLRLSKGSKQLIIINTIVPVLYAWAETHDDWPLRERLLDLLRRLPGENNHILRQWQACGLQATTAADSQALIQLKKQYCDRCDCLRCRFGYEYLKETS